MPQLQEIKNPYVVRNLPQWRKARWLIFLLLFPLLMAIYGTVLLLVYKLLSTSDEKAVLHSRPAVGAWYFLGLLLSVGTAGLWMNKIYQVYNKRRYKPLPFNTTEPKIEGFPLFKGLAWIFSLAAIAFMLLISDNYIIICNDRITVNKFTDVGEKTYAIKDIQSITFIKNVKRRGKLKHSPHHIIHFTDGSLYETRDNILDDGPVIELLSKQWGKPIDTLLQRPR